MENVKAFVSKKFIKDFSSWAMWLERQGYRNFWKVLNAKNNGVPQNRERVCMVSILDCTDMYIFPKSFKLEKRLKDVLEDNVDESFYLSDKRIANFIEDLNGGGRISEHQWGVCYSKEANVINTLCAHDYKDAPKIVERPNAYLEKDATVMQVGQMYGTENNSQRGRVYSPNGISPCLMSHEQGAGIEPKIIQCGRGFNKGGIKSDSPTISANSWECNNFVCFGKEVSTICINSKVNGKQPSLADRIYSDNGVMTACTPSFRPNVLTNFRIRKLTPRECFRLMDCAEDDIDKIQAADISKSSQYRLAGNSIVVSRLYHIFRKMFVEKKTDIGQVVQLSLF